MAIEAPPKTLVEKYLIEIAKALNIEYEPDESVFEEERIRKEAEKRRNEACLIDFNELHSDPMLPPTLPSTSHDPNMHPPNLPQRAPDSGIVRPIGFDLSNTALLNKEMMSLNPATNDDQQQASKRQSPPPSYDTVNTPPFSKPSSASSFSTRSQDQNKTNSDLPNVPKSLPNANISAPNASNDDEEDIDFDDLAKRFESLKKN